MSRKLFLGALVWMALPLGQSALAADDLGGILDLACQAGQIVGAPGTPGAPTNFLQDLTNFVCQIAQAWKNAAENYDQLRKNLWFMRDSFKRGLLADADESVGLWDLSVLKQPAYAGDQAYTKALAGAGIASESELKNIPRNIAEDISRELEAAARQLDCGQTASQNQNGQGQNGGGGCKGPDLDELRKKIVDIIKREGEKAVKFANVYTQERNKQLQDKKRALDQARNEYDSLLRQIQELTYKEGKSFNDPVVKDLVKRLQSAQDRYQREQREMAELVRKYNLEQQVLARVLSDVARIASQADSGAAREITTLGAQTIAAKIANDDSLKKLADKTKEAGQALYQEAQNATSTRAAVQLLARGLAELNNTQVASQMAI